MTARDAARSLQHELMLQKCTAGTRTCDGCVSPGSGFLLFPFFLSFAVSVETAATAFPVLSPRGRGPGEGGFERILLISECECCPVL